MWIKFNPLSSHAPYITFSFLVKGLVFILIVIIYLFICLVICLFIHLQSLDNLLFLTVDVIVKFNPLSSHVPYITSSAFLDKWLVFILVLII